MRKVDKLYEEVVYEGERRYDPFRIKRCGPITEETLVYEHKVAASIVEWYPPKTKESLLESINKWHLTYFKDIKVNKIDETYSEITFKQVHYKTIPTFEEVIVKSRIPF